MKKIAVALFILASFTIHAAGKSSTSVKITGVKGDVLTNVQKRLDELKELKPLKELSTNELENQVINALQPFGYFKAEVIIINRSPSKISIRINAGPIMYITALNINMIGDGAQNPALTKILKKLPLHVGDPLVTTEYNQLKQNLLSTAENLGYLHATFKKAEILVDRSKNTAEITLIFNTGPLYYFGQVQFDPTNIRPELLHRFVPFHQGEAYSSDQVLKLNNDLTASGYFNSVLVKPQITDTPTVPLQVLLQPVPKYSYTLGVGYGTDTGPRGRAALHVTPVNNKGHKFNAVAQGSFNQNVLQAQYVVPGANPVTDQYSLTGNFSNLNYDAGYSNSYLVSLAQQHNLAYYQRALSLNALYESFNYTYQPKEDQFLLYPKATFTFTNVDTKNTLFTPSGYNITLNGLGGAKALLSSINFAQASIDARAALMIEPLKLRLYAHTLQGITETANINQLPLSLALLLGGADNLKGYGFNSIGPGKIISYGGFEIQKETVKNWYLVGFYDVGAVYNPTLKNTNYDVGAELMWVSPIGPIKIGVAQPVTNRLERVENSSPRLVIHLGPDL